MAEHIYELGVQKVTGAAAGPVVTIVPGVLAAGIRTPDIREIGVFSVSGIAAEIGIGVPAAAGTGGTSVVGTVQPLNPIDPAGHTTVVSSYVTLQPTVPASFIRRAEIQAVVGAGIIWTWNPGEFLMWSGAAIAGAVMVWQISALAVTYDVYVKVSE